MSAPVYQPLPELDEAAARAGVRAANPAERARTILAAALSGLPRAVIEPMLLATLSDAELVVRRAAATASGHAARIHHALDAKIVERLRELARDAATKGAASDALDDVETFTR
ncbi:hypothetical protein L6R52_19190 [Myxococcota bacterium]|nr:hypothetical protein [Myxococcota bacterium]